MQDLHIKKAYIDDLDEILCIYRRAVSHMDSLGIFQWDEVYPDKDILRSDIEKGNMYLAVLSGRISSVVVINRECDADYYNCTWNFPDANYAVVHRLCVDPAVQNQGVGTKTMLLVEKMLSGLGFDAVRLDAFSKNPFSLKMYDKLGYQIVGDATWRKGYFYLLEKDLHLGGK